MMTFLLLLLLQMILTTSAHSCWTLFLERKEKNKINPDAAKTKQNLAYLPFL